MFDNCDENGRIVIVKAAEKGARRECAGRKLPPIETLCDYQDGDRPTGSDRNDQPSATRYYRPCGIRTTLFDPPRRATVNVYVRPRRTFTVVEVDREEPGPADTANTRIPVDTERLKLLPATRLATVLPSS
jgi:hypothetical protein